LELRITLTRISYFLACGLTLFSLSQIFFIKSSFCGQPEKFFQKIKYPIILTFRKIKSKISFKKVPTFTTNADYYSHRYSISTARF